MSIKNRGVLKRKHYPYAHEAKANNLLYLIKQGHTIDLFIEKGARTTIFTWWTTTTVGVVY